MSINKSSVNPFAALENAHYIRVDSKTGELEGIDFFSWAYEKLKGMCCLRDHANPKLIEKTIIEIIKFNQIKISDPSCIITIAKKAGIIRDDKDLSEHQDLANAIADASLKVPQKKREPEPVVDTSANENELKVEQPIYTANSSKIISPNENKAESALILPEPPPPQQPIIPPRGIPTPKHENACYRNSVNQVVRALIDKNILNNISSNKNVHEELLHLYEVLDDPNASNSDILSAERNFRTTLFNSKIFCGLGLSQATKQQDALAYLDMILQTLLNRTFLVCEDIFSDSSQAATLNQNIAEDTVMRLKMKKEDNTLQSLIEEYFAGSEVKDNYTIGGLKYPSYFRKPKLMSAPVDPFVIALDRARSLSDEEKERRLEADIKAIEKATGQLLSAEERMKFKQDPTNQVEDAVEQDTRPIKLPDDYKITIDSYEGNSEHELKAFIIRDGESVNGHFRSYVNKGGKWFECDDGKVVSADSNKVKKEAGKAYILFFNKT